MTSPRKVKYSVARNYSLRMYRDEAIGTYRKLDNEFKDSNSLRNLNVVSRDRPHSCNLGSQSFREVGTREFRGQSLLHLKKARSRYSLNLPKHSNLDLDAGFDENANTQQLSEPLRNFEDRGKLGINVKAEEISGFDFVPERDIVPLPDVEPLISADGSCLLTGGRKNEENKYSEKDSDVTENANVHSKLSQSESETSLIRQRNNSSCSNSSHSSRSDSANGSDSGNSKETLPSGNINKEAFEKQEQNEKSTEIVSEQFVHAATESILVDSPEHEDDSESQTRSVVKRSSFKETFPKDVLLEFQDKKDTAECREFSYNVEIYEDGVHEIFDSDEHFNGQSVNPVCAKISLPASPRGKSTENSVPPLPSTLPPDAIDKASIGSLIDVETVSSSFSFSEHSDSPASDSDLETELNILRSEVEAKLRMASEERSRTLNGDHKDRLKVAYYGPIYASNNTLILPEETLESTLQVKRANSLKNISADENIRSIATDKEMKINSNIPSMFSDAPSEDILTSENIALNHSPVQLQIHPNGTCDCNESTTQHPEENEQSLAEELGDKYSESIIQHPEGNEESLAKELEDKDSESIIQHPEGNGDSLAKELEDKDSESITQHPEKYKHRFAEELEDKDSDSGSIIIGDIMFQTKPSDSGYNGISADNTQNMPNSSDQSPASSTFQSRNIASVNADVHCVSESLDKAVTTSIDEGQQKTPGRHRGHLVVVAIDFGTTYSGYAFSFTCDPGNIYMMRKCEGGDPGVINQKTPTSILLTPDGSFHSFGYSARDNYHDLDTVEAQNWLYFDKFKMILHHSEELSKDTVIKASNGRLFPALTVFSHALQFFKHHALQELSDQSEMKIINEDVRWVISVPAIWKASAKQFMRQAAYEAGLISPDFPDQLIIALEPEAASIYCRKLRMHQLVPETPIVRPLQSPRKSTLEPMNMDPVCENIAPEWTPIDDEAKDQFHGVFEGCRYMVVDCGGGTVDITVHELSDSCKLRELYRASGGPYGSVGVDIEFEKLLGQIFGKEFIAQYRIKRPYGWVDLMIAFESRKRSASPHRSSCLNISLPFSFIHYFKKHKIGHIENAVKKYGNKDIQWSSQGMLRLTQDEMRKLFIPTIDKITNAIGDVLNSPDTRNLQYLFLVGGFAESPLLQTEIRKEFGSLLKIIIPQGVGMTILKGSVMFGLDPSIVSVRKSRQTYGVGVLNKFTLDKHPEDKKVCRNNREWCTDVFDKYIITDQPIALGDIVLRSYTPMSTNQKQSQINVYCCENSDVKYVTDVGVRRCGTLLLNLSDDHGCLPHRREIQTRMHFGETEIKVSALDVATGQSVEARIDFLNT